MAYAQDIATYDTMFRNQWAPLSVSIGALNQVPAQVAAQRGLFAMDQAAKRDLLERELRSREDQIRLQNAGHLESMKAYAAAQHANEMSRMGKPEGMTDAEFYKLRSERMKQMFERGAKLSNDAMSRALSALKMFNDSKEMAAREAGIGAAMALGHSRDAVELVIAGKAQAAGLSNEKAQPIVNAFTMKRDQVLADPNAGDPKYLGEYKKYSDLSTQIQQNIRDMMPDWKSVGIPPELDWSAFLPSEELPPPAAAPRITLPPTVSKKSPPGGVMGYLTSNTTLPVVIPTGAGFNETTSELTSHQARVALDFLRTYQAAAAAGPPSYIGGLAPVFPYKSPQPVNLPSIPPTPAVTNILSQPRMLNSPGVSPYSGVTNLLGQQFIPAVTNAPIVNSPLSLGIQPIDYTTGMRAWPGQ